MGLLIVISGWPFNLSHTVIEIKKKNKVKNKTKIFKDVICNFAISDHKWLGPELEKSVNGENINFKCSMTFKEIHLKCTRAVESAKTEYYAELIN